MAVSACLVAAVLALLGSIFDFVPALSGPEKIETERLTVIVREAVPEPEPGLAADEHVVPPPAEEEMAASGDISGQQGPVNDHTPGRQAMANPS